MKSKAKQIMTTDLSVVQESDRVSKAFQLMNEKRIRHLPVVNSLKEVTGILSDRDVMRAASPGVVYNHGFVFEDLVIDPEVLVFDYMTTPALTLPLDTPIKEVAEKMVEHKISCYLISDGKTIVGMVTSEDLLKFLTHIIGEASSKWQINLRGLLTNPLFGKISQSISDIGI